MAISCKTLDEGNSARTRINTGESERLGNVRPDFRARHIKTASGTSVLHQNNFAQGNRLAKSRAKTASLRA